ncbi:hypothetical protein [Nitrincola sp. MINF-07-Sa-05]|uniref:hypothetical protein n=1 Tax=Nitrincola salilacus TaxID=3400273 RepID=UPI003917FAEA
MIVSTEKTLIAMIEHKEVFLSLIDHIDHHGGPEEMPVRQYHQLVRAMLDCQSEVEQKRLRAMFDLENLRRADLVIEVDRNRAVFVFAPFVIDMFRHFDRRRLRELSSAQLEDLRRRFYDSLEALRLCTLQPGDRQFDEQLELLRVHIRYTQAKMRDNVNSLQGQAERLSEMVEQMELGNLEQNRQASTALEQIDQIYRHHVLPTLQFLNERESLKEGQPALTSLRDIAVLLHHAGLPQLSQQVRYASASIRAHASDVEKIRRSLERYVRQNAQQRLQYNALETAFNELLQAARSLQDGSLKNNFLRKDDPVFRFGHLFSGLHGVRYGARLEWHGYDQRRHFEEFLRVRVDQLRQQASTSQVVELDAEAEDFERQQQYRKETIRQLMREWVSPESCADLQLALHDYLQQVLPDYQLVDVLEAMKWFVSEKDFQVIPEFRQRAIQHEGFELVYYVRALEPVYAS